MFMPFRYQITPEQIEEIVKARVSTKDKNIDARLRVLLLYFSGVPRREIESKTDYSLRAISKIVAKYMDCGLAYFIQNQYKGNRRNLSFEEEATLLAPFKDKSEQGQIIDLQEIIIAYEQAIGRSIEKSSAQIYRVLERHGWRKVMPRSKHPNKASDEVIDASKKLTQSSKKSWKVTKKTMFY
jgi:transposase